MLALYCTPVAHTVHSLAGTGEATRLTLKGEGGLKGRDDSIALDDKKQNGRKDPRGHKHPAVSVRAAIIMELGYSQRVKLGFSG